MDKKEIENMYLTFLKSEGFECQILYEGVEFKDENVVYLLPKEEDNFFQITCDITKLSSNADIMDVMLLINEMNFGYRSGKISLVISDDETSKDVFVIADGGTYLSKKEDFKLFFKILLDEIKNIRNEFLINCYQHNDRLEEKNKTEKTAYNRNDRRNRPVGKGN